MLAELIEVHEQCSRDGYWPARSSSAPARVDIRKQRSHTVSMGTEKSGSSMAARDGSTRSGACRAMLPAIPMSSVRADHVDASICHRDGEDHIFKRFDAVTIF